MVVIFAKDDWRGFSTWLAMFEQKLDHPQLINLFYLGIFHKRTAAGASRTWKKCDGGAACFFESS